MAKWPCALFFFQKFRSNFLIRLALPIFAAWIKAKVPQFPRLRILKGGKNQTLYLGVSLSLSLSLVSGDIH